MASWMSNFLTSKLYCDVLKYKLIEEVDADSLSYDLQLSGQSHNVLTVISLITAVFVSLASISIVNCHIGLIFAFLIVFISAVFIYVFVFIRYIPRKIFDILRKTKSAYTILKRREQVTFGLGLSPSLGQRKLRLKVFRIFRELIKFFCLKANTIAEHVTGERDRLLANFYSREIVQLLEQEVDEKSTLIDDGGLSTLINLLSLHISELCRLYLIYCSKLANSDWVHFTKLSYFISKSLEEYIRIVMEIEKRPPVDTISIENEKTIVNIQSYEAVALALNAISSSILSQQLSPEETKKDIQKLLAMEWFKVATNEAPVGSSEDLVVTPENTRSAVVVLPENGPIVDQVFEALADKNQPITACYDDDISLATSITAASLMEELKVALGGRSKEYESRERKALAIFYGITEEELLKQEAAESKEKESALEHLGEAVGESEEWQPQRKPVLNSELLQALAKRGPVQEAILGDSSDDD